MKNMETNGANTSPIFLMKTALIISAVAVILLTPFSIIHFIEGRVLLGLSSFAIVIISALNTWNCIYKHYQPLLILYGLVPCIIMSLILIFRELGIEGMLWSYPAALSFYFMLPGRYAWIANTLLLAIVVPQAWISVDTVLATRFAATLLMTSIFAGIFITFISKQQSKLETIAVTDSLTGLFNRSLLQNTLDRAIEQSRRKGTPMTLLMLDIDHFKTINDTLGHFIGDNVLRDLGDYFQQRVRGADTVFRIGGEEFIILLNDTNGTTAHRVAENMRKEIALLPLLSEQAVTISVGIAELQPEDDINNWLKCADKNLYKAKSAGRNQVAICSLDDGEQIQQT